MVESLRRRLEGDGSEARLRRINRRFRQFSKRAGLAVKRRGAPGRRELTVWLMVWAAVAGAALVLFGVRAGVLE